MANYKEEIDYGVEEDDDDEDNGEDSDGDEMVTTAKKTKKEGENNDDEEIDLEDLDEDDDDELEDDDDEGIDEDEGIEMNEENNAKHSFAHFDELKDETDDDENDDDENYLQKFGENLQKNVIAEFHPELHSHNYNEIEALSVVFRDPNGIIVDPLHKTLPFITRYEKARILGERAKQINAGAKPFTQVDANIIDGYLIALKEFEEKKIPFIVKRPLPNGGCEYWKFRDLEILS